MEKIKNNEVVVTSPSKGDVVKLRLYRDNIAQMQRRIGVITSVRKGVINYSFDNIEGKKLKASVDVNSLARNGYCYAGFEPKELI